MLKLTDFGSRRILLLPRFEQALHLPGRQDRQHGGQDGGEHHLLPNWGQNQVKKEVKRNFKKYKILTFWGREEAELIAYQVLGQFVREDLFNLYLNATGKAKKSIFEPKSKKQEYTDFDDPKVIPPLQTPNQP